jgi:hypothetical protein
MWTIDGMGYDLRITRAPGHWVEVNDGGITADEWLTLIAEDPELSLEAGRKHFARWAGPSRYPDPWFGWWKGTIKTKNPDAPMIAKMVQMAERLKARVQGDDGEVYLPAGRVEKDGVVDKRDGMDWRQW